MNYCQKIQKKDQLFFVRGYPRALKAFKLLTS